MNKETLKQLAWENLTKIFPTVRKPQKNGTVNARIGNISVNVDPKVKGCARYNVFIKPLGESKGTYLTWAQKNQSKYKNSEVFYGNKGHNPHLSIYGIEPSSLKETLQGIRTAHSNSSKVTPNC